MPLNIVYLRPQIQNTTFILIHYGSGKKYGGSKTLRQGLWNTLFLGENSQEISTNSEVPSDTKFMTSEKLFWNNYF